jgi:hypothetical protein
MMFLQHALLMNALVKRCIVLIPKRLFLMNDGNNSTVSTGHRFQLFLQDCCLPVLRERLCDRFHLGLLVQQLVNLLVKQP